MSVIIGVDPHKATHTAVAIDRTEAELARTRVRATRTQIPQLLPWAEPLGERTWAIESAGGLGYLVAQQLVATGEIVLDVPATLASRVRVLGTGRSDKNDPNDALSVAIAALRAPSLARSLPPITPRYCGSWRSATATSGSIAPGSCAVFITCSWSSPGGIAKELNASDAVALLEGVRPVTPVDQARHDLAIELLADVQRLDEQLKDSHRRIRTAVAASQTSLTELFGVGPSSCYLIGFTGDIGRFVSRDAYAAYNGTAPVEGSSGGRIVHRVTQRGNRRLNHALHLAAICQIRQPHAEGRAYFERKLAERKTKTDAIRSLKHHISNTVYRQLIIDAAPAEGIGGPGRGTRNVSVVQRDRRPSRTPALRTKPLPGPAKQPYARRRRAASSRPQSAPNQGLTQRCRSGARGSGSAVAPGSAPGAGTDLGQLSPITWNRNGKHQVRPDTP